MNEQKLIPVWDVLIRVFHWSLVVSFTVAYLTEDDFETLHAYAGYTVLALISFRVIWGFIGTRYARFSDFVCSPKEINSYLFSLLAGKPKHYLGHNPAGGAMIIALLLSLFATTISGLKVYGAEGHGPLADNAYEISVISTAHADDDDDSDEQENNEEELWEEIHEFFANFTLLLVFLHIASVIIASHVHKENLVKAMITGKKINK